MAVESSKKTKGKQVIEIKRIEEEADRMVTFSKRKAGIYKKANEIAILTGAQVGLVVFSPSGKPYSFGHPSIEAVSNRLLGLDTPSSNDHATKALIEASRQVRIAELIQYHNDLLAQLERGKIMEEIKKGKNMQGWWETPINDLNMNELLQMDKAFEDLSKILHNKVNQRSLARGGASSSSFPPMDDISHIWSQFPHDDPRS